MVDRIEQNWAELRERMKTMYRPIAPMDDGQAIVTQTQQQHIATQNDTVPVQGEGQEHHQEQMAVAGQMSGFFLF